jgi:hypothetical protein
MAIARCLVAIVTSAAVFHHGRLSGRDYCDALRVLLGAQTIDAFTAGLQKRLGKLLHWRSPYLLRIVRVDNSEAYRIPPEIGLLIPGVMVGARLAIRVGNEWLRRIILTAVWLLGLKVLFFDLLGCRVGRYASKPVSK